MRMALEWLLPSHAAAAICNDRQSLLKAAQSGSADTAYLRHKINKRAGKTNLLGISGHHWIAGNEEADACAKQAAAITDDAPRPVSFPGASALIRRTLTDPPPCHLSTKDVYTKTLSWPTDHRAGPTRCRSPLLSMNWSHPPPFLKAYANQLDTTVDPNCPSCRYESQTVEHWLQRCPNAIALRQQLFSEPSPPLGQCASAY